MRAVFIVALMLGLIAANIAPIKAGCYSWQWECDDGWCVDDDDHCDGHEECPDGSDEDGCVYINVALVVGLSVAGFVFLICLPIIIVCVICCCVISAANSRSTRTRVITTAPPVTGGGTTVVSTASSHTSGGYMPVPTNYPAHGYPAHGYPANPPPKPLGAYPPEYPSEYHPAPPNYPPPTYK